MENFDFTLKNLCVTNKNKGISKIFYRILIATSTSLILVYAELFVMIEDQFNVFP